MFRILLVLLGASAAITLANNTTGTRESEARDLVRQFVGELKPALKTAIQEGGPAHAVDVCATLAPAIMDELSNESGWTVRRVSLQPRNRNRAVPDEWEAEVLKTFDALQASGQPPATINHGAVVDGRYRYMQAQGVEPLCLNCHGETLSEPVRQALQTHYPEDQATGYSLGEVRGAISLIEPR
ncbi:hypothetical protein CWI75_07295 [Kineobactrum sediminis]|uniref:Tll0287-like domain-containing protein n=1 Tax=Kineobactrum sediminis TaxID=1905677 RepID=A0A2N5Y487_9GAMM|nr:DUF3365 domain-containing protein [Kineobactrum sediminis]PLW83210.1 hypothetical protein CWI75_07295 [Kineobactrum sediminis]